MFREYAYFSSVSDAFVEHARQVAPRLAAERGLDGSSLVLEVASNDGYLLQHYARAGIPVLGIDPARNIAEAATVRGIPTMPEFFGLELARQLRSEGRLADVVHANNVLAHVPDLHGVVAGIAHILKPGGIAVIETPYVRDMVERLEFDTIYHEHLFYFSLSAMRDVFARDGLAIVDVERIPMHGGSLRVFATHDGAAETTLAVDALLAEEAELGVSTAAYYRDFAERVDTLRVELKGLLAELKADGHRIAAYGAAAKGAILLNAFGIGRETIAFVADRSPHKQERYMPGVHLPIAPPERLLQEMPEETLLLAWNFADEILAQQASYRQRGGRFIIPIPKPIVV
jgi:SAM-dependent methyltransferase